MPLLMPRAKIRQTGSATFTLVSTTANITLGRQMPSADYDVYYRLASGVSVAVAVPSANKTITGFTMTVGAAIATTIEWVVMEK